MKRRFTILLALLCLIIAIPTSAYADEANENINVAFYFDGRLNYLDPAKTPGVIQWYIDDVYVEKLEVDLNGATMKLNEPINLYNGITLTIHNGKIDCQGLTNAVYLSGKGVKLQMYDLEIINGKASDGGAIYVGAENCVVENPKKNDSAIINGCHAANCGGAIKLDANSDGSKVSYIVFKENRAEDDGGAIITNGNKNTIEYCRFYTNTCADAGGAIYVWDPCKIEECFFTENDGSYGKDIYAADYLELNECTFDDHFRSDALYLYKNKYLTEDSGNKFFTVVGTTLSQGNIVIIIALAVIAIAAVVLIIMKRKKTA